MVMGICRSNDRVVTIAAYAVVLKLTEWQHISPRIIQKKTNDRTRERSSGHGDISFKLECQL